MAKRVGFSKCEVRYFQRFSITNLLAWLKYRKPMSIGTSHYSPKAQFDYDFITETLDAVYKSELEKNGWADFMVAYLEK